jgi:hypothetical protein
MVAAAVLGGCTPSASAKLAAQLSAEKAALRPARSFPIAPDAMRAGDVRAKAGDFVIYPNTQFCGLGIMNPKVAAAIDPADPERVMRTFPIRTGADDARIEAMGLHYGTTRDSGFHAMIERDVSRLASACPDNAVNIMMTHHVGLNAAGRPYRVTLTARQGNRFWSASVERPDYVRPTMGRDTFIQGTGSAWHPDVDAAHLNDAFQQLLFGSKQQ